MKPAITISAAVLVAMFAGACSSDPTTGYSFSSTFPNSVRTVSVPVFNNYTYETGLESQLTEAIIKELQKSSQIRVVQSGGADTVLKGVITNAEMRRMSLDRVTGLTQEVGYTITCDFDFTDTRSGELLTSRRSFAASDTFVAARPSGERMELGQRGAVQRLAKDIVNELRATW